MKCSCSTCSKEKGGIKAVYILAKDSDLELNSLTVEQLDSINGFYVDGSKPLPEPYIKNGQRFYPQTITWELDVSNHNSSKEA